MLDLEDKIKVINATIRISEEVSSKWNSKKVVWDIEVPQKHLEEYVTDDTTLVLNGVGRISLVHALARLNVIFDIDKSYSFKAISVKPSISKIQGELSDVTIMLTLHTPCHKGE